MAVSVPDNTLILVSRQNEIVRTVAENIAVSIISPPATGKSLLVPAFFGIDGTKVLVSSPTRSSAIAHKTMFSILHPSIRVDYITEGKNNYDRDAVVIYATSGKVKNILMSKFDNGVVSPYTEFKILIIDEIHTGSVDNSVIVGLWGKAMLSKTVFPRLITLTATPVPITIVPPPVEIVIPEEGHNVPRLKYMRDYHDNSERYSAIVNEVVRYHNMMTVESGHFIIFLPSMGVVKQVSARMTRGMNERRVSKKYVIIAMYGKMTAEISDSLYREMNPDVRKIVITTNVLESSITIPKVGYVFDSMLEKRLLPTPTGGSRLDIVFISKTSAMQRMWRTGRTMRGEAIRFISEAKYETLSQSYPLDILTVPIHRTIIELISRKIIPIRSIVRDVPEEKVNKMVAELSNLKMINVGGLSVLPIGQYGLRLSTSIRQSAFIWYWIGAGYPPFPGIVCTVILDIDPSELFNYPHFTGRDRIAINKRKKEHDDKYFQRFVGSNQLVTCLNVWNTMMIETDGAPMNNNYRVFGDWCAKNSIRLETINVIIREIYRVSTSYNQVYNVEDKKNKPVESGPFNTDNFMNAALGILNTVYVDRLFKKIDRPNIAGSKVENYERLPDYYDPSTGFEPEADKYIVVRSAIPGRYYNTFKYLAIVTKEGQNGKHGLIIMGIPPKERPEVAVVQITEEGSAQLFDASAMGITPEVIPHIDEAEYVMGREEQKEEEVRTPTVSTPTSGRSTGAAVPVPIMDAGIMMTIDWRSEEEYDVITIPSSALFISDEYVTGEDLIPYVAGRESVEVMSPGPVQMIEVEEYETFTIEEDDPNSIAGWTLPAPTINVARGVIFTTMKLKTG